mgnify:FL=1
MAKDPKRTKTFSESLANSAQAMDGDTLTNALVFNGQCFLVQQMHALTRPGTKSDTQKRSTKAAEYIKGATALSGLKYSAPIYSSANVKPEQIFSKLTQVVATQGGKIEDLNHRLLGLTPAQMASLVPKIRLYKLIYKAKNSIKGGVIEIDRDKPPTRQEIIFDDHVKKEDLDKMLSERGGRMSGTGIKSFKWSLKGVNPAEVDANITAELVVHFNTIKDLAPPGAGIASYMDLIVYSSAEQKDVSVAQYDGQFFEIQAIVGWARPPGTPSDLFTSADLSAIEKAQTPLYLQLTKHKFAFNQDGSADLTINYRARTADTDRGYDIFNVDTTYLERVDKAKTAAASESANKKDKAELELANRDLNRLLERRYSSVVRVLERAVWVADATPLQLRAFTTTGASRETTTAEQRQQRAENRAETINKSRNALAAEREEYKQAITKTREEIDAIEDPAEREKARVTQAAREVAAQEAFKAREAELDTSAAAAEAQADDTHAGTAATSTTTSIEALQEAISNARDTADEAFNIGADTKEGYSHAMAAGPGDTSNFFSAYLTGDIDHKSFFTKKTNIRMRKIIRGKTRGGRYHPDGSRRIYNSQQGRFEESGEELDRVVHAAMDLPGTSSRYTQRYAIAQDQKKGVVEVPFVFFGDLLDAVVDGMDTNGSTRMKEDFKKRHFGLLLGDFRFYNLERFYGAAKSRQSVSGDPVMSFFTEFQMGAYEFSKKGFTRSDMYNTINLANFPIHLDVFLDWFIRKVVKPRRQRYFFHHFIRDILTDLVAPAMSSRCFYGLPRMNVQPLMLDFPAYKNDSIPQTLFPAGNEKELAAWDGKKKTSEEAGNSSRWASMNILLSKDSEPRLPMQVRANDTKAGHINLRYLTMNALGPDYMTGKYQDNIDSGIAHFVVGQDRGLLKNATFQRSDAPYLREARTSRARTLGAAQLRELYNVTLSLYGTPMMKPGQYVYVTPSQMGFGDVRTKGSIARTLGIGGYHLVVDVESRIDRTGYETTVKALHQCYPIAK